MLDKHGQPTNLAFNRKPRKDRTINELLGLAKGIIADGKVCHQEADFLMKWLRVNHWASDDPLVSRISERVEDMLADNVLDKQEQKELLELLTEFTGPTSATDQIENMASTLPLDTPPPDIYFEGDVFCFTGKFYFGTRKDCHEVTESLGGIIEQKVSTGIDYLVIGSAGSRD